MPVLLRNAHVFCESRPIAYTIRFSSRARSLGMAISPQTGLVVTAPPTCHEDVVARFVGRHKRWVLRHTERLERLASRIPKRWPYGPTLPYLGEERRVVVQDSDDAPSVHSTPDRVLLVRMARPGVDGARRLLKRWYMAEALRRLQERVMLFGARMGISWRRLRIGDQRTRWGSCSGRGDLSFNYRLIMAPGAIMDYVVQHELLHCVQLNHSRAFWTLMAIHCPAYRDAVVWLRTYGPYLTV